MLIEKKAAREIIIKDVYRRLDTMGYGKKEHGAGHVYYSVKGKQMTVSEYQNYCIKKELERFGIK